jgi:predicted tellurium resistance membrane protein TerC
MIDGADRDGCGIHVPKGYVYAAMAFSAFVEILNLVCAQAEVEAWRQPDQH